MISIPFKIYAKIIPDRFGNKRRTYTKSMEKIAEFIKDDINDYITSNPSVANVVIAESDVSVTPQFAQYPSRVTIVGFHNIDLNNFQVASKVLKDAPFSDVQDDIYDAGNDQPGKYVAGYMATQYLDPQGQIVDSRVVSNMRDLKFIMETASSYLDDIFRIDYMGFTFGETGYSF